MYISDITHFLDEKGNIPIEMPKEAREMANFLALIIDVTTLTKPSTLTNSRIRCFSKGCSGDIKSKLKNSAEIHWYCPKCENEGIINNWENTKWHNR